MGEHAVYVMVRPSLEKVNPMSCTHVYIIHNVIQKKKKKNTICNVRTIMCIRVL